MNAPLIQRSPLHALHLELGAKMVEFAGYEMPVQYPPGILREHAHTREAAGLFDISHMGLLYLAGGTELDAAMERLFPSDVAGIAPGAQRYCLLLNENGGVIDDIVIARPEDEPHSLLLVSNASRKQVVAAHLRAALPQAAVELQADRALLALQGPEAANALARFCDAPQRLRFMQTARCALGRFGEARIGRSGYTGEDGFEIALDARRAESFARALLAEPEVMAIGLGARDSLRLEAGLALYGHELDETVTPVEAGLAWTIPKRRRESGGFAGADIVLRQIERGPARRLAGIRPEGKAIAREGTEVLQNGRVVGRIASGGFGPSVGGPIATAYVEAECAKPGARVQLRIRGKDWPAAIAALPFVPHRYKR
jgi:aminomethyltransferase